MNDKDKRDKPIISAVYNNILERNEEHCDGESLKESQFDGLAQLYESTGLWPYRKDIEIPNILSLAGNVSGLSVFDFGCGTGMFSRWMKVRGAERVVAYDPAMGMLEYAKNEANKKLLQIEFLSELNPELDATFDLVLGVYVLPYASTIYELEEMCGTMANLVKPGGRLITLPIHFDYEPNPEYYAEFGLTLEPESENPYKDGGKVKLSFCNSNLDIRIRAYYWSRETLTRALTKAGFSSVKEIKIFTSSTGSVDSICQTLQKYLMKPHAAILECKM